MSIELKQAAQRALNALDEATTYTGSPSWSPSMTDECIAAASALRAALAQQPATGEPVGFTYQAEIEYADSTGGNGSFWRVPPDLDDESVPLYTRPAPSVPDEKPLPDLMMASYHEAIGWNACRAAMLAAK